MTKLKRYTEGILVRLSKKQKADLLAECDRIPLEPAIYGRKAIELCIKKHLVNHQK
jgi:hypothetical protein